MSGRIADVTKLDMKHAEPLQVNKMKIKFIAPAANLRIKTREKFHPITPSTAEYIM
jgi:hypothetical protein